MSKLREITDQFKELSALAEGADEDTTAAIRDTLLGIEAEFNDKALAVSHVMLNAAADVAALDAEIARLQARKKVITNREAWFKGYLRENMEAADIKKISCPLFSITLGKGREVAVIDNEDLIPDNLMSVKTTMAPDKAAILKLLKDGTEVPGARIERGQSSISIK